MEEKYWHAEEAADGQSSPFPAKHALSKPGGSQLLRFCKEERLCKRTLMDTLFSEGKAVHTTGFTLVYFFTPLPTAFPAQIVFSVPKKKFPRAHQRNRVKRLMREAWRHQKGGCYQWLQAANRQLAVAWLCKGNEIPDYQTVYSALEKLLQRLMKPETLH